MLHRLQLALLSVVALMLSGCLIPEKFDAKLLVYKDGSYSFHYEGTLIYLQKSDPAREEALSGNDEEGREIITEELAQEPGFKNVEYLGRGRYKILVEKKAKAGEAYRFVTNESKALTILPQRDGSILITSSRFDQEFVQLMATLGGKIDGKLQVSVESGAKVIKHNADQESWSPDALSRYTWRFEAPGAPALMHILP